MTTAIALTPWPPMLREMVEAYELNLNEPGGSKVGSTIYYGGGAAAHQLNRWLRKRGFTERYEWGDQPYRYVWANANLRCIVEYCEGDVSLWVSPDVWTFAHEIEAMERFHERL